MAHVVSACCEALRGFAQVSFDGDAVLERTHGQRVYGGGVVEADLDATVTRLLGEAHEVTVAYRKHIETLDVWLVERRVARRGPSGAWGNWSWSL
jgi:hypothetical protein